MDTSFPMLELLPGSINLKGVSSEAHLLVTCLTSCCPELLFCTTVTIQYLVFLSVPCQAKLRYDPIELDPEDMCRMASEQPQVRMCMAIKDLRRGWHNHLNHVYHVCLRECIYQELIDC